MYVVVNKQIKKGTTSAFWKQKCGNLKNVSIASFNAFRRFYSVSETHTIFNPFPFSDTNKCSLQNAALTQKEYTVRADEWRLLKCSPLLNPPWLKNTRKKGANKMLSMQMVIKSVHRLCTCVTYMHLLKIGSLYNAITWI